MNLISRLILLACFIKLFFNGPSPIKTNPLNLISRLIIKLFFNGPSPIKTILSLTYYIGGVNEVSPLLLNLIFGNLFILVLYVILKKENLPPPAILLGLLLMIVLIPLPTIIYTGLEHTLHILITIVFVYFVSKVLSNDKKQGQAKLDFQEKAILLLVPLVTMVRFEGMFLVIVVMVLFILKKKKNFSLILGALGFLPIVIFGLISILYGHHFFPNSIILKGNIPDFTSLNSIIGNIYTFGVHFYEALMDNPHLLILLIGASLFFYVRGYKKKEVWSEPCIISIIFISITILQLLFADASYISNIVSIYRTRYDAFLVALGIFMVLLSIKDYIPNHIFLHIKNYFSEIKKDFSVDVFLQNFSIFTVIFLVLTPFIYRITFITIQTPQASKNIHEQQYQMGLFLKTYYKGETIAVNDIGAVNFIANIECIDLMGLMDIDIANARRSKTFDMDEYTKDKDCKIAIIYDHWFQVPSSWVKVGEWTITNNVVCSEDTVSFYAVDLEEIDNLISNLQDFSDQLPKDVIESSI